MFVDNVARETPGKADRRSIAESKNALARPSSAYAGEGSDTLASSSRSVRKPASTEIKRWKL